MMTKLVLTASILAALQTGAVAQGGWTQVTTTGPAPPDRYGHAMAYDSQRGKTVLFGGINGAGTLSDTWEWDGTSWALVSITGPAARYDHAMAFDSQRGRTVMFGGVWWQGQGDTWEWDGTTWTQRTTTGPSGYSPYAMAYDIQRGRTVLCGSNPSGTLRPTFEWDGNGWTSVLSAPGGGYAAMAYDSQRGRTVLFGGSGITAWEWDGGTWTPTASGPVYRAYSAMAYDSQRGKTLLFGGYTTGVFYGDTWEWNGTHWAQLASSGPLARGWHAMVYDSQRGKTVLFGGQPAGDMWEWDGVPGSASTFGTGCGNPMLTLSPIVNSPPTISTTTQASLTQIPSSLAFVALGWSRTLVGPFALPFSLVGYGMPSCYMLQSSQAAAQPVTFTGLSTATYSLPLPNWSGLIGLHLYLQGWAVAPGANPGGTIVSNGLDWLIGY